MHHALHPIMTKMTMNKTNIAAKLQSEVSFWEELENDRCADSQSIHTAAPEEAQAPPVKRSAREYPRVSAASVLVQIEAAAPWLDAE